jgi:hypothetical protein
VKTWLVEKAGVDGKRSKTKGWGKTNPGRPTPIPMAATILTDVRKTVGWKSR